MAIKQKSKVLRDSDLYQNGRVYLLDDGREYLLRERLSVGALTGDSFANLSDAQDIRLLAWQRWRGDVKDAERWWWLICDRNNIYNPLFNLQVTASGDSIQYTDIISVIPNLLKQKPIL